MEPNENEESKVHYPYSDKFEANIRPSEKAKKSVKESRQLNRENVIGSRRFGDEYSQQLKDNESLEDILVSLQSSKFLDRSLLLKLKSILSSGAENPEEFFLSGCGDQNLHNLVNIMSNNGHESQLLAVEILANLCPLSEKSGLKLARAGGPYFITLLSSSSYSLKEASAIAIGNLALSGFKVVKVLLHQDVIDRLSTNLPDPNLNDSQLNQTSHDTDTSSFSKVTSATLYALYHVIHTMDCAQFSNTGASNK